MPAISTQRQVSLPSPGAAPLRAGGSTTASALELLSVREREIAVLVASGYSNKEIARELEISPWTVSAHLRRIFTKLDISRRMQLCKLVLLIKGLV